jgi:predicted MFS family arabinose efflux permease
MLAWNAGWAVSAWVSGYIQLAAGFTPLFAITATLYSVSILMTHLSFRNVGESTEAEHASAQGDAGFRAGVYPREE